MCFDAVTTFHSALYSFFLLLTFIQYVLCNCAQHFIFAPAMPLLWFPYEALFSSCAISSRVYVAQDGISQGCIVKSNAAGLWGICRLSYFRYSQTALQKDYAILVPTNHAQGHGMTCPHS